MVAAQRVAIAVTNHVPTCPTNVGLSLMHVGLYAAYKAGLLRWCSLPGCLQVAAIKHSPAPGLYNVPTAATAAHWQVNAAIIASTGGHAIY